MDTFLLLPASNGTSSGCLHPVGPRRGVCIQCGACKHCGACIRWVLTAVLASSGTCRGACLQGGFALVSVASQFGPSETLCSSFGTSGKVNFHLLYKIQSGGSMTDPYINSYSAHKSTFLELPQQQKPPPTKPVQIPARTCTPVTAGGAVPASAGALPWGHALPGCLHPLGPCIGACIHWDLTAVPASTGSSPWWPHPVRCLHAVGPAAVPVSRGGFALVSVASQLGPSETLCSSFGTSGKVNFHLLYKIQSGGSMTDPYINFYSAHKSTFLELPQQQKPPPTKPVLIPARTCTTVTAHGAVPASGGALPWSRVLPVPASTGTLYWCLHPVRCLHAMGPATVPVCLQGRFRLGVSSQPVRPIRDIVLFIWNFREGQLSFTIQNSVRGIYDRPLH